jgi:MraZ protein
MFLNQYQHNFDDKGRLTIPSKFRDLPETGAYVVEGLDQNLWVLPPDIFKLISDRLQAMSITDPLARQLKHIILGNALPVTPDSAGRIMLTQNLKDYAGLKNSVVFVGQGDFFEIWSVERWQAEQALINDAAVNAGRFAALDLSTR